MVVLGQPEPHPALWPGRWGDQLAQGLEDLAQLLVVLAELCPGLPLEFLEPLLECGVGGRSAAELNERPHDLDVDGDRPLAPQDTQSIATPCSVNTYGA
jgi:hypothetical protein